MKYIIQPLALIGLIVLMSACGGQETNSLADKQTKLKALKAELLKVSQEIQSLEAEIAELDPEQKVAAKRVSVILSELKPENFQHFVEIQGKVEANQNIQVSPKVSGVIQQIYVREGQSVRSGAVLAQLDDAIIKRNIEEIETQLDLASILYDKQKRLWEQEIGTEVQYLTSKNQKETLERRLATLKEQADQSKIKSPISGVIDEVMPKSGEAVSAGFPVFRVVNTRDLSLKAELSESYIASVQKGDQVRIKFPVIDRELDSKVTSVGQAIDPTNRTFTVEVRLPNNALFKPNMFGTLAINDKSIEDAITVPLSILQSSDEGSFVYVAAQEGGEWVAKRKMIKIGSAYQDKVSIEEGLSAGELLITTGFQDLSDGQFLEISQPSTSSLSLN